MAIGDSALYGGGSMISALRMHWVLIKVALAGRMAYRGDFLISVIISLLFELVIPMVTILVYHSGATFPGWGLYEVLLIQGVFLLAKGIAFPLFYGMVWNVLARVRDGNFDLLLIKPRSILYLTIATGFDSIGLGKFGGGMVLFGYALSHLPVPGWLNWVQFLVFFILALSIMLAFTLLMSGSLFKWVGNSRVYEIFDSITAFGLYPVSIFSKTLQNLITWVIPVAMIGFFPAAVLLGQPTVSLFGALGVSALFLGFSWWFWHYMLKNYTSAGG